MMVVTTPLSVHVRFDIAKALSTGQLRHHQSDKLVPTAYFAQMLALVVLLCQRLEFMSRKRLRSCEKTVQACAKA